MKRGVRTYLSLPQLMRMFFPLLFVLHLSAPAFSQQPEYGGILKIIDVAEGAQPIGAPWDIRGIDTKLIKPAVEALIREDIKGNYHPFLATEWKVDQKNNSVTLKLRRGVKFHDGTDFNAESAKWCIDQAIKAKAVPGLKSVDIVDPYTISINLEQYKNDILYILSSSRTSFVSPLTFTKMPKDQAIWNPIGTGPFRFVTYERGNKLSFKKFEGYWQKGKPYLDGIEYLLIRDPMTQQAAMMTSGKERAHVLCTTLAEQAAMMKAQGFKILNMPIGPVSLIPDSANPDSPLSNKKVRQAISYAINRDAIVKARGFGFFSPANQIPPPGVSGHVEEKEFGRYDPNRAKELLKEAGYPNGFNIKIIVMPAMVDREAMVAVQRMLGQVGIQVEFEFPDGGRYTAYRWKDGWKNALLAQHTRMLATTNITYDFYWQEVTGQWPSLKRPEGFIQKLNASLATPAPEEKRMRELTKIMIDEAMIIPLYHIYEMYVVQPNVHDTGYTEWSSTTVYAPENAWLGKEK